MHYTFRMIFSGPCYYLPNTIQPEPGKSPDTAKSWSVALPDLRRGKPGTDEFYEQQVQIAPHFPTLIYTADQFEATKPLLEYTRQGQKKRGMFLTKSKQIKIKTGNRRAVKTNFSEIPRATKRDPEKIKKLKEEEIRSLEWVPAMNHISPSTCWLGNNSKMFDNTNGLPILDESNIISHYILEEGTLYAHKLSERNPGTPAIWQFRPLGYDEHHAYPTQAVAEYVALEIKDLKEPISIIMSGNGSTEEIKVKQDISDSEVNIEVRNRELENIFLPEHKASGRIYIPTIDKNIEVDKDFRCLYDNLFGYDRPNMEYPLAHFSLNNAGAGERATCGGALVEGFSYLAVTKEIIKKWEE